jgi:probable addiction module antidote protein
MPRRSKKYEVGLAQRLQELQYAVAYLNASLEDSPEGFLLALRDVAAARQGLGGIAEITGMNRENLYRMLSESGNPQYSSLWEVLGALGLKLAIRVASALPGNEEEDMDLGRIDKLANEGGTGQASNQGQQVADIGVYRDQKQSALAARAMTTQMSTEQSGLLGKRCAL